MKHIYISLICTLITGVIFSQQSSISGTITDQKTGEPIVGATVYLKPFVKGKGTSTNIDGNYKLDSISKGSYTLHISYIGFETIEEEIMLGENENIIKNYAIEEGAFELQDVEIVGRKRTSYKPDVTYAGAKVAVDIKEVSQSIAIINKEIIKDQGIFRLNEVTANVAGVTRTRANNNFTSRGFRIGHDFINGNRAYFPGFSSSSIATQYERIEFIKGPATALFGNSSPGGVVNAVTKKPLKENRAYASISAGGFSELDDIATKRATLDITGPLNKEKTLLYRTNVAWEDMEQFTDFVRNKSILFAPSLSYLFSDKTRVNIDIVGNFNDDQAGLSTSRGVPVLQNDLFALPISFNSAEPYDYRRNSHTLLTISGSHKFSDLLTLNTSYTRSDFNQDFLETRSSNTLTPDGTELIRQINDRRADGSSNFITTYLVANFNTGSIKHKALLGWDYYELEEEFENRGATGETNGVPNLVFSNRVPIQNISELSISFDESSRLSTGKRSYRGFYFQDLIETGKFKILAALRYEKLGQLNTIVNGNPTDALDDDVFLPRLGITYILNEQVNLYASYTEGFELQGFPTVVNTLRPGEGFDPLKSNQIEIGTKTSFFKNKLLAQLSFYNINRSGKILAEPSGGNFFALQLGQESSRGVELELTGNIMSNLTLTANYAFNEVEFGKEDLNNLRRIGNLLNTSLSNNPKHTAGFWGKYTFKSTLLKNLDIGLGGNFVSDNQLFNSALNRTSEFFTFPSYFILNQRIGYTLKNINISLNINNVLDERYYIGGVDIARVFPGAPRNFLFTVGYQF